MNSLRSGEVELAYEGDPPPKTTFSGPFALKAETQGGGGHDEVEVVRVRGIFLFFLFSFSDFTVMPEFLCPFSPDKMGRKRAVAWAHSSLGASREALVIKVLGAAAGGTLIPLQEATCPQKKDMAQHWQEAKYFCQ